MRFFHSLTLVITLICTLALISCSRTGAPTEPSLNDTDLPTISEPTGSRQAIAVYDAVIDPVAQTFTITQERTASFHFPLSNSIPSTLSIVGYGWTPTFWADIKITHPYPGSGVAVFDPRVIAIIPAAPGYSFNYPNFAVNGNNSVVYQQDGYTTLFDNLGGSIAGNCNPFKAYMKTQPYRVWLSTGPKTSETQRWYMNLAGFGGPANYKLVLDVSTNYPAAPHQITDNAPEPVAGRIDVQAGLTSQGGGAYCYVYLTDWHGGESISGVGVESPQLFSGSESLTYQGYYAPNEYYFWSWVYNSLLAPPGTYKILFVGTDRDTGIRYYQEGTAEVKPPYPTNPIDATPQKVNWTPEDMVIDGEFMYTACGVNGFIIFSIYEQYMNWFTGNKPATCDFRAIDYSDGYCYIADYLNNKLCVYDVSPVGYVLPVRTVDLPAAPYDVDITPDGNFAFVADGSGGIQIVDITIPESASIIKSVPTTGSARSVVTTSEYAYVADSSSGLQILYIFPILDSQIIKTVAIPHNATKVAVSGIYVYVLDDLSGLHVVEAVPFDSAAIIKTVLFPDAPQDIFISQNYAYIADNVYNFEIVDITDPYNAYRYRAVDTPLRGHSIVKSGYYAWVADKWAGMEVINVYNPGAPSLVNTYKTPGNVRDIHLLGDYEYVGTGVEGFQLYKKGDEATPIFWNVNYPAGQVMGLDVEGEIAVLGCYSAGAAIYDISPAGTATLITTVDTPGLAYDVDIAGDYAYVADRDAGLSIIKINPPASAYLVKTVDTPGYAYDVRVYGNYAYIADSTGGLQIININPPASASIVKAVSMPDQAIGVDYQNGYAFVGANASGLQIVDVDPVNSASIVKTVDTPGTAYGVFAYGDFVYVADGSSGLQNIKINPISSAAIFSAVDTPGTALDVYVETEFAYVADDRGGIRTIELW